MVALALAALASAQPADDDLYHTVEAGDTLISIAFAYGVSLDQLLTLNDLQPEALLQIGQRLLVIRAPEFAEQNDETEAVEAVLAEVEAETETEVDGASQRDDLPPAPVADADAPMRDPADISPQLCFGVFEDDNQNGMMDPGETMLPGATIILLEDDGAERLRFTADAEPYCPPQLERRRYTVVAEAPPGFGLTLSSRLRIDLREGGPVQADFGAKQGLTPPVPPAQPPASRDDARPPDAARSLLRELSGLFALGLALLVFFSGLAVSLFLRGR